MVTHCWTLSGTRAGTGPCTATKALGPTGPGPEQAPHEYIRTDQDTALTQERGEQGYVWGESEGVLGRCGWAEGRGLALLKTQPAP